MKPKLLLFIALFTITIGGISVDLYAPSLPWIAQYMKVGQSLAKYTISVFLIGFSLGQIVFGIFSDVRGRKGALYIGLIVFVLASFAASFSPNIYVLMIFRFIQGVGAASCSVIAKTLLTDSLTGNELHKAMTSLSIAWAIGPIVAPVIGGYLQHHFDWQANFYFYTAYSLVLLLTVLFLLKETLKNKLEFKASSIKQHYGRLFRHPAFFSGIVVLGLSYSLIIAFNVMGPFIIQRTLKYGPIVFGHMALLVGLAFFVGTSISRYLAKSYSPIGVIKLALVLINIIGVLYVIESYFVKTSLFSIVLPTFLIIVAVGLIFPNCLSTCMSFFTEISGIASSLLGCIIYMTTTITSAVFSVISLSSQLPYAWSLLCVMFVMTLVLILGFFPGVRSLQKE